MTGSTLVMRAITLDDAKAVRKAVSVTARGERASKLLNVPRRGTSSEYPLDWTWQDHKGTLNILWCNKVIVGTHSISPLLWAIENASLVAADAILQAVRFSMCFGILDTFQSKRTVIVIWFLTAGLA